MSLAQSSSLAALARDRRAFRRLPQLQGAPAVFKAAVRLIARNFVIGSVTFVMPSGEELYIPGVEPGPDAKIVIRDFRFIRRALAAGDIGFAEAYMAGEFDTPNLPDLLYVFAANWDRVHHVTMGSPLTWAINRIRHALKTNSRQGAKKNIHAHYDLGNAFYSRWLDPTMTYSSARFQQPGQPLSEAQVAKYRALSQTMGLQTGQSVLEIGCGWGGFAEFAAREVGAKVTAITISEEQYAFAKQRMFEAGLNEKAEIKLVDYRDVDGRFDRVASIEMFEAVGERYWPTYFGKIRESLTPGGRAGLQIITIKDQYFDQYRSRADFIQKYVFPGGMLPSEERLRKVTDKAGLVWTALDRFGRDYADTLAEWHRSFDAAWNDIRPLGFDERFRKLWKFYLSYCEAGFRTERTSVVQLGLAKA
ncbi:MAG TPA: cyclopropane-fatty-acyl-phospholipid synthase family protein [Phenylobacterium sp.]|jgi:cyclopropane-fatty-acyl-phospholipid synthase|uniref:cyclopropane-fatty-acyl-phospholipid synthase family protein n=1 Tax=Phenylobacterium sp. TaxID=1871053 RepID=UPI002B5F9581|nr:cyclopropane-fatty-acyl-phospholipid synthase family protein [Phenylobacterium sp.]HXA38472.1 cyclopropane-fatty-acyl-phospholipid synthase family protein [Phenylobacterium sp.]